MQGTRRTRMEWRGGLATPRRNRFFHGKMMDVYHFELETAYGIAMRRLLNRMVVGTGVVCGLDVVEGDDPCTVIVTSGVAIDGWGREIIVPADSAPVAIPAALIDRVCAEEPEADASAGPRRRPDHEDDPCVTVTLCYQECDGDPVAVLAGDCSTATPCAPGAIREQYSIGFEPGCADPVEVSCRFPDVLRHGEIDYGALARWVTRECPDPPRDPCVPLANLRLRRDDDGCVIQDVDIEIRPVVFGNAVLFDILTRIVEESRPDNGRRR